MTRPVSGRSRPKSRTISAVSDCRLSAVIPVSARDGVGITEHTYTSEWYRPTVVEALDAHSTRAAGRPNCRLRLPIQAVYKFDDRRILAGRIESGRIAVGDEWWCCPPG